MSPAELEVISLSLQVAGASVLCSLLPGLALGWLLARRRWRFLPLLHGLVMLPLVLPPVVTGYILLQLLGRGGPLGEIWLQVLGRAPAYSTAACVIAAAVVGFPLLVESIRLALLGVDPRLEQVSRSLGRGPLATWLRITLPLSMPGVLAGAVLAFARALGEFGATIVLAGNIAGQTRTIPLAVYTLLNQPGGETSAGRLVAVSVTCSLAALIGSSWLMRRQRARLGQP